MKVSIAKIAIVFCLAITLFVSVCLPSYAAPRRVEECGVERYNSQASPACGVQSYISTRSFACGVELFKQVKSRACPGYKNEVSAWVSQSAVCPSGYRKTTETRRECRTVYGDSGLNRLSCFTQERCIHPEVIPTCRKEEFGVERYKECRDPSHGVEAYNTCERAEFGVAVFRECEIRKTKPELTAYIANLEPNIDVMGVALLQTTANLLKLDGNETGLACYIKRWESDSLYSDAIDELKAIQFPALFGVAYDPNNYDCSRASQLEVSADTCSDNTPRCKFQTAYNASLEFFKTNKAEVEALMNDVVAQSDATYKTQLENLNAKLDNYFRA